MKEIISLVRCLSCWLLMLIVLISSQFTTILPRILKEESRILKDYRDASGQLINFQKSSMFFSRNAGSELRRNLSTFMSVPVRGDLGRYLGLPVEIGKLKTEMFSSTLVVSKNESFRYWRDGRRNFLTLLGRVFCFGR